MVQIIARSELASLKSTELEQPVGPITIAWLLALGRKLL